MDYSKKPKYRTVDQLPPGAKPVSVYSREMGYSAPQVVYNQYNRYLEGSIGPDGKRRFSKYPGYDIVRYFGLNYIVAGEPPTEKKQKTKKQKHENKN